MEVERKELSAELEETLAPFASLLPRGYVFASCPRLLECLKYSGTSQEPYLVDLSIGRPSQ